MNTNGIKKNSTQRCPNIYCSMNQQYEEEVQKAYLIRKSEIATLLCYSLAGPKTYLIFKEQWQRWSRRNSSTVTGPPPTPGGTQQGSQ